MPPPRFGFAQSRCRPHPGLEARVKHDVIAFTMAVGESIGDRLPLAWLHYGMTSMMSLTPRKPSRFARLQN